MSEGAVVTRGLSFGDAVDHLVEVVPVLPSNWHPGQARRDGERDVVGILTDGDLRRQIGPDLLNARVEDVMSRNPKTIDRGSLASEAIELLNASNIMMLVVTDANRPVGIRPGPPRSLRSADAARLPDGEVRPDRLGRKGDRADRRDHRP